MNKKNGKAPAVAKLAPKKIGKSESSVSSSSESDSSSDLSLGGQNKPSVEVNCVNAGEQDTYQITKKRRTGDDGTAVTTATTASFATTTNGEKNLNLTGFIKGANSNKKNGHPTNERFMRVRPEAVAMDNAFVDNRYEAKVCLVYSFSRGFASQPGYFRNLRMSFQAGPSNDYGQRAHSDLIVTRGAGFRKEKNKKKRGSYRGGEITVSSLLRVCSGMLYQPGCSTDGKS